MNLPPLPIILFYLVVTAIPVGAWLKYQFFKRLKETNTFKKRIKEVVILITILLLGLLTANLLIGFNTLFRGVEWYVLLGTSAFAFIPVYAWIKFIHQKRVSRMKEKTEKKAQKWILLTIFVLGTLTVPLLSLFYEFLNANPTLNFYQHLYESMVSLQETEYFLAEPESMAQAIAGEAYQKALNIYDTVTIIIDALLEEIVKISLMIFFIRTLKLVHTLSDAIAFSVLAGLGFAFIENIVFFVSVYQDTTKSMAVFINVVIFRTIVLSVGHMTFSGIFGYFYGLSRFAFPVYEEEKWEGVKFPLFKWISRHFRFHTFQVLAMALIYEGAVLAMLTHAAFNTFISFGHRDYAIYLVLATSIYLYYLTQRKAGHLVLAHLGERRMSLMAPRDEDVILELAGMWINEGKYKEVEEVCDRLAKRDPDNAVVKLLHAKAHDKRRLKRAALALQSLFFQEDIFEEDISLFERFQQARETRGEWKPGDKGEDPFKRESKGPQGPDLQKVNKFKDNLKSKADSIKKGEQK
jgi:RsiW-degrading membrane proteinase PrsW (M82 family)